MSPTAVRRLLVSRRLRRATAAVLILCGLAISLHHAILPSAGGHHEPDVSAVAGMCMAAFVAVGAAAVAVALGLVALGRWPACAGPSLISAPSPVPGVRARAGPRLLLLLCVSRR